MLDWLLVFGIVAVPFALTVIVSALAKADTEKDEE